MTEMMTSRQEAEERLSEFVRAGNYTPDASWGDIYYHAGLAAITAEIEARRKAEATLAKYKDIARLAELEAALETKE